MSTWPIDPPANFDSCCPRCGEQGEGTCKWCVQELNTQLAKKENHVLWVAAYDFAASCGQVQTFLDRGRDLYDLDHEVGESWQAADVLLRAVGVVAIDDDDRLELAAEEASKVLGEEVKVWS